MNIYELVDILGKEIEIIRHPGGKFSCKFISCKTKENEKDTCLTSDPGFGQDVISAVNDYTQKISGKILIFDCFSDTNTKHFCPKLEFIE